MKLSEKTITRIHNRIIYWSQFPLCSSETNPFFGKKDSVSTPEFENWYKNQIMELIINDWQIKKIEDFKNKFNTIWENKPAGDYIILAKNWYNEPRITVKWEDIF